MATFTPIRRTKTTFVAQPDVAGGGFLLNIGDEYALNIGDGYELLISPLGRGGISWTPLNKTR